MVRVVELLLVQLQHHLSLRSTSLQQNQRRRRRHPSAVHAAHLLGARQRQLREAPGLHPQNLEVVVPLRQVVHRHQQELSRHKLKNCLKSTTLFHTMTPPQYTSICAKSARELLALSTLPLIQEPESKLLSSR